MIGTEERLAALTERVRGVGNMCKRRGLVSNDPFYGELGMLLKMLGLEVTRSSRKIAKLREAAGI